MKFESRQLDIYYEVTRQVKQKIANSEALASLCLKKKVLHSSICDVDAIEEEIDI